MVKRVKEKDKSGEQDSDNFEWRDKFKPTIYFPDEKGDSLEQVLLERNPLCDIYWYKWPHDGFFFYLVKDYEPVVIIFEEKSVYGVLTRPHWDYKPYRVSEGLSMPSEILFRGSSHASLANNSEINDRFDMEKNTLITRDYQPDPVNTEAILMMYRTGVGHPSNLRLLVKDPLVRATEIYDEFKNE